MEHKTTFNLDEIKEIKIKNDTFRQIYSELIAEELGLKTEQVLNTMNNPVKLKYKLKDISHNQIREIINLLHKDYRTYKTKIKLYDNIFSILKEYIKTFRRKPLSHYKNSNGIMTGDTIDLFYLNIKKTIKSSNFDNEKKKTYMLLAFVDVLFHELRHIYQMNFFSDKFNKASKNYINALGEGYRSQWIERDAFKFSHRMINKHKEEISRILNIGLDWEYNFGKLKINEVEK